MTELQELNCLIEDEFINFKINQEAKPAIQQLSQLTELTTPTHTQWAFNFLCHARYWETAIGISTKKRLLNLIKRQLKIPIF